MSLQRMEQAVAGRVDLVHGVQKGRLIGLRRSGEPADLADELKRGRANLGIRDRRLEIEQSLDASTHGGFIRLPLLLLGGVVVQSVVVRFVRDKYVFLQCEMGGSIERSRGDADLIPAGLLPEHIAAAA